MLITAIPLGPPQLDGLPALHVFGMFYVETGATQQSTSTPSI